jgi:hypothetical protein
MLFVKSSGKTRESEEIVDAPPYGTVGQLEDSRSNSGNSAAACPIFDFEINTSSDAPCCHERPSGDSSADRTPLMRSIVSR